MRDGSMAVTPNPVSGETMNVQFTNMEGGEYKVELFNSIGQIVYKGSISHTGGSSVYKISTGVSMKAKGIYQLKLGNGHDQFSTQIVSQ
jgi:hypothetical protein